ncbi:MAG TPA: peptidoglycan DD-metalloendopeptidase family protein [Caulobacteraceae bacterium]|jgi:septal ring factor EnvC (AmiA/AmiB activator)
MRARVPLLATLLLTAAGAAAASGAKGKAALGPAAAVKPSPQALALARAVRDDRAEARGAEAQIVHLRQQLTALAAVEAAGERGAGDKRARLQRLTEQEDALVARLGESQNATARLLGALALYRRDPPPALLVHPQSAKDAVRAQILARALAPEIEARSHALAVQLADLRTLRRQVDAASEDLFTSESAVADQRAKLEQGIADKTVLQRSLAAQAETDEAQLRELARQSKAPADLLSRLPPGAESLGPVPEHLIEPVQGRLAARYGEAAFPGAPKAGFTWKTTPGAPVLAPAAGIVEYAGPLKDYGVILILRTGGAYHLVLTGLGAAEAVVGTTVAAGEPVGRMGEDAGSGPSLYLEVRKGGEPVDPKRWFKTAAR